MNLPEETYHATFSILLDTVYFSNVVQPNTKAINLSFELRKFLSPLVSLKGTNAAVIVKWLWFFFQLKFYFIFCNRICEGELTEE